MTDFFQPTEKPRHNGSLAALGLALFMVASSVLISGCNAGDGSSGISLAALQPTENNVAETAAVEENEASQPEKPSELITCDSSSHLRLANIMQISAPLGLDRDAALLAMEVSGGLVADTIEYQRIAAELAALRSAFPSQTALSARPCFPNRLLLWIHEQATDSEKYHAYNEHLNAIASSFAHNSYAVTLEFGTGFNMSQLAAEYEALPNVEHATPDAYRNDSNDICIEELPNEQHLYIFDDTGGDCFSGCTGHEYTGFTADPSGNIEFLGSFTRGEAQPEWFSNAQQCRVFL